MTYGELQRIKNIKNANNKKNQCNIIELEEASLYHLERGRGSQNILLNLTEMFAITEYVKKNF